MLEGQKEPASAGFLLPGKNTGIEPGREAAPA
jgi:hypothetical protein